MAGFVVFFLITWEEINMNRLNVENILWHIRDVNKGKKPWQNDEQGLCVTSLSLTDNTLDVHLGDGGP